MECELETLALTLREGVSDGVVEAVCASDGDDVGVTDTVAVDVAVMLTDGETDALCDGAAVADCVADSDVESEMVGEAVDVAEFVADREVEGVMVGVTLGVLVGDGGSCAKFTFVHDMIPGREADIVLELPAAYATIVLPDVLICASFGLPLFTVRVHVITVLPPDCEHAKFPVPVVDSGFNPASEDCVIVYSCTVLAPGMQITAFVRGVSVMKPLALMPTANLPRTHAQIGRVRDIVDKRVTANQLQAISACTQRAP